MVIIKIDLKNMESKILYRIFIGYLKLRVVVWFIMILFFFMISIVFEIIIMIIIIWKEGLEKGYKIERIIIDFKFIYFYSFGFFIS